MTPSPKAHLRHFCKRAQAASLTSDSSANRCDSYCVPFIVYGFIGVETVTVMGARSHKNLAWSSRWIIYLAVLVGVILALVEYLNVGWQDTRLPGPWFQYSGGQQHSTVLSVLAAQDYTSHILPGLVTGCLIYTTVSTSNTVLYFASRALYGVFRSFPPSAPPLGRLAKLGGSKRRDSLSTQRDGLPIWAIIVSVLSFWWLPFTTLSSGDSIKDVSHTLRSRLMSRSFGKPD